VVDERRDYKPRWREGVVEAASARVEAVVGRGDRWPVLTALTPTDEQNNVWKKGERATYTTVIPFLATSWSNSTKGEGRRIRVWAGADGGRRSRV
jgi:hypothetical protein